MVFLDIQLDVEGNFIQEIIAEGEMFRWYFTIKCNSCNEQFENEIYFTELEEVEMQGSRGVAHFGATCKNCKRWGYITLHNSSAKKLRLEGGHGKGTFATFDCRGIEIVKWEPHNQLVGIAEESETKFQEMDLSDLPWCDYDEKTQNNVEIEKFEQEIVRNKHLK